ncbi:hypothetical protein UR09_00750 [Candidatus Nitromaritima sp. SCGC AAA799-A02]|nr:hypothetical protein UR09_00750 [Candidatus Nitromaritima sp. SCGC AAA799-A02]
MSLTIFPQAFSVGFTPKASPPASQPKSPPPDPGVNTQPDVDVHVEMSQLDPVKIIPEETKTGGNDVSSDGGLVNHRTAFRINSESNEVVIKVIDSNTGEEVREIPDTSHQELNQRIREYQNLAFDQE